MRPWTQTTSTTKDVVHRNARLCIEDARSGAALEVQARHRRSKLPVSKLVYCGALPAFGFGTEVTGLAPSLSAKFTSKAANLLHISTGLGLLHKELQKPLITRSR